jgi:cytochrome c oxidase cbb3-type subunit 3
MTRTRLIAVSACELIIATYLSAQTPPPPAPVPQNGRGQAGRGGGRGPNFPQQTRPLAASEVLARGKSLYGVHCGACHGADLRGGDQGGPNLLRSMLALSDQHGELIGPVILGSRQDKGMPDFNLPASDTTALAEYIHSILALVGRQGRPPGAEGGENLKILVGSAAAGKAFFEAKCAACHSVGGDLKGIATKFPEPRTLQDTWVSGGGGGGRGGEDPLGKPITVTVTLSSGSTLEGRLVRIDDFDVTLVQNNGRRQTIARDGDNPKVEIHDPKAAHKALAPLLSDKEMHDVTAFLATNK